MASNWESLTDDEDVEVTDAERARFRGAWNEHRRVMGYTLLQELPFALRRALHDHDDLSGIDIDLLIVDEYQDLNACDLEVLRLLSVKGDCAVIGTGDDDQSIYSSRMAAPEGIRRFLSDFYPSEDYPLTVSLRCGRRIIEWANYVIQGDPDRPLGHGVLAPLSGSADGEVALLSFKGETTEARGVADLVRILVDKAVEPRDILVLTRTDNNGSFSKPIRAELEKLGIPYSDPSYVQALLELADNRKLLEWLRLLVDANDSISWSSLLLLTNGIGQGFFEYIYDLAKAKGVTFASELLRGYETGFSSASTSASKVKEAMAEVLAWVAQTELPNEQPQEGWGQWIIGTVCKEEAISKPTPEFQKLLLSLDGLVESGQSLGRYLAQIEPLGKDLALSQADGVRIMIMRGSKGLTVRATIIAGVEDGLVPRPKCDLSEERRILYVAMTRAKDYLFCTWALRRRGPTARAGDASANRRRYSDFLSGGTVESQDGKQFLNDRSPGD